MVAFKKNLSHNSHGWLLFLTLLICVCTSVPEHCGDFVSIGKEGCLPDDPPPPPPTTYTLTVDSNPTEGGAATGYGTFTDGTNTPISATANNNCTFIGWTGTGIDDPVADSTTVFMTTNRSVTANFHCEGDPIRYVLTVNAYPEYCAATLTEGGLYDAGTSVDIYVTAAENCTFDGWTGEGIADTSLMSTTVLMDDNKTVTANFTVIPPDPCADLTSAIPGSPCCLSDSSFNGCSDDDGDSFTDRRDGQIYRTVKIGNQTWMAENLNFDTLDSRCYGNSPDSCAKYGRLYDWMTVMSLPSSCHDNSCTALISSPHQGICPAGWHVPDYDEWRTLIVFAGDSSVAGTKLKSVTNWHVDTGTDDYGFSALPGGFGRDGSFYDIGVGGNWWSASEDGAGNAWGLNMGGEYSSVHTYWDNKALRFSLRCLSDVRP